jgi:hypothetical protein
MKFGNDFDFANDLMVELLQVFCWDPILLVDSTCYLMNFLAAQKVTSNPKARDIA